MDALSRTSLQISRGGVPTPKTMLQVCCRQGGCTSKMGTRSSCSTLPVDVSQMASGVSGGQLPLQDGVGCGGSCMPGAKIDRLDARAEMGAHGSDLDMCVFRAAFGNEAVLGGP